jgi:hypothetical protein
VEQRTGHLDRVVGRIEAVQGRIEGAHLAPDQAGQRGLVWRSAQRARTLGLLEIREGARQG